MYISINPLHILAPQVENIFRTLAEEVGALTVTLGKDGTSMEKVLSSVFDLPELVDCYDGDILFTFKGLLNEQAGANIRNKIAHGIMNESTAFSGASIYFLCATIKILSFTSARCMEIYGRYQISPRDKNQSLYIDYETLKQMSAEEVENLIYPPENIRRKDVSVMPDYQAVYEHLSKPGSKANLFYLWLKYKKECPSGYQYT